MSSSGGLSITLGPEAVYRAVEVMQRRLYRGAFHESLVRWARHPRPRPGEEKAAASDEEHRAKEEGRLRESFDVWMRREELESCCPHLLVSREQEPAGDGEGGGGGGGPDAAQEQEPGEAELAEDIRGLVARARRFEAGGGSSKVLTNTIGILSAYARIGTMANAFREVGALDLLLSLLSSHHLEVRRSASDMLRSLAAFDSGSRAYVLLKLAQGGVEGTVEEEGGAGGEGKGGAETTVQGRQMLLDLFAETASSSEFAALLGGINLPHVPGRFLFSLLKKYLRVTTLAKGDLASSPARDSSGAELLGGSFELFSVTFQLVSELFSVLGWRRPGSGEGPGSVPGRLAWGLSIFTGTFPDRQLSAARKKRKSVFKTREDYSTDKDYGQYVKTNIQPAMRVRARVAYESVVEGDIGTYRQTNDGTPPAQFAWEGLRGDTYWVFWHMIELLPPSGEDTTEEDPGESAQVAFQRPQRQSYMLGSARGQRSKVEGAEEQLLTRAMWWEILCLVQPLPDTVVATIADCLQNNSFKSFSDLLPLLPTFSQALATLRLLETDFPHLRHEPLSVKDLPTFALLYYKACRHDDPDARAKEETKAEPYKAKPPHPDPFDVEPSLELLVDSNVSGPHMDGDVLGPLPPPPPPPPPLLSTAMSSLSRLMRRNRPERTQSGLSRRLEALRQDQDGSLDKMMSAKETLEACLDRHAGSCRVAVAGLDVISSAVARIKDEATRQDLCTSGLFGLVLRLMRVKPESPHLQGRGLDCFFELTGGYGFNETLPSCPGEPAPAPLSEATRSLIAVMLLSLASVTEYGGLKTLVDAVTCVSGYYNLEMSRDKKRTCVNSVRKGLCIIISLLSDADTKQQLVGWGLLDLIKSLQTQFPDFPTKNKLSSLIVSACPGDLAPGDKMAAEQEDFADDVPPKVVEKEIAAVIHLLGKSDLTGDPLTPLVRLLGHSTGTACSFPHAPDHFSSAFLLHSGVAALTGAMEINRTTSFILNALSILGSIASVGEKEMAEVVLQGGLRATINCLRAFPGNLEIQEDCVTILELMSRDPDLVTIVAAESVVAALQATKEKHSGEAKLSTPIANIIKNCEEEGKTRAAQHQKILGIIFSGVLQLLLTGVEEARRCREMVSIPKFSAFMNYLSGGHDSGASGINLGEKERCFDRIEVSSNSSRMARLLDGDSSTYWESSGRAGTHWIRMHMKKGLVIKRLSIQVNSSDSSYVPQKITILGGPGPDDVQDISTVQIPNAFSGEWELLKDAKKYFAVILIKIKRCQQSGIDTRVRTLNCEAARSSMWSVFGDPFVARTKLFYRIQLDTWTKDRSIGPLELFDMMSAVVLHEQQFADSCLFMPVSRQYLGQACRSALITPLIRALTEPQGSGPNLEGLVRDYITQTQLPLGPHWRLLVSSSPDDVEAPPTEGWPDMQQAQRLVTMSRVRRMCRMLVDCNDSQIGAVGDEGAGHSTTETKTGTGPLDEALSGTTMMGRCWRKIVGLEVAKVLCQLGAWDAPHNVAVEILQLYNRLKHGMLELFGGHAQFALALKEGFSKALQGLNEVEGVKFCELLCLSIDSLLDPAGKDAQRFQHLPESQREDIVMHLAEPLQFLHNLDLAHVFEHYYRRHLTARLLRGRYHSLPLEQRLVQAFAHCFPHKYPLQMLQDLDDSSVLMQRFCDTELLENLDHLLVQTAAQDKPSEDILLMAHRYSLYRQRTLQVHTLNPCFWSLRQRPMPPLASLPTPIRSFCQDYQQFFVAFHTIGLRQHERARKLHWTLHGFGVVSSCGLQLYVSTAQLIVLLHFNQTQVHTLKSLQSCTELGHSELCDALLALTADRQSLLQSSATSPPHHDATSPLPEDDGYFPNTPFKPSTSFWVNERFAEEIARRHESNHFRFHDVRLVGKSLGQPGQSREERSIDLAHVFERRRAIIDSAIVRVLKKEKTLSVDTMAVKVINGCAVGHFEGGVAFNHFNCDYRDMCSRVDRLIMDGYLKRDTSNPQMLIYVPDPLTGKEDGKPVNEADGSVAPSPQGTTEQHSPGNSASPLRSSEVPSATHEEDPEPMDTGPDTVLPSMAPEHVDPVKSSEQLSSAGDSPVTPEEPPAASSPVKRGLSRKRHGGNRPTLVRMKRKPQFTRMYTNDMYDSEAPLLGMLAITPSLTAGQVQAEIDSMLDSIVQVLKADKSILEHLLQHSHWNKDLLIQSYLGNSGGLLEGAGLAGGVVSLPPSPGAEVACPVCLLSVSRTEAAWLWCRHACCKTCWLYHLREQLDMNRALVCSCPVVGCAARPTREFFSGIFGPDSEEMEKLSKALLRSYVEQSGRLKWCCNPQGCDQVLCRGDGMNTGTCHKCQWSSCFSCQFIEAHQPANCDDLTKWAEQGGFTEGMDKDAKSKQLASIIAKPCPNCNAKIEKNEGCLHMKCKCGHGFCWKCMKPWKPTHTDYYNCSAKISKAARDHKKFADYNLRCTQFHKSRMFANKLCLLVKGITEPVPMKALSFLSDACKLLVECHRMLSYACVAEYFSEPDSSAYLSFLSENLEGDTNAMQAFLENTLLSVSDISHAVRLIPDRLLLDGYRLVSRIQNTREKLLLGFSQQFKLCQSPLTSAGATSDEKSVTTQEADAASDMSGSGPSVSTVNTSTDEEEDEEEEDEDEEDDDISYRYSDYEYESPYDIDEDDY